MQDRLYGLDALRGMAAIVVVVFHLGLPVEGAHLAVDFFFMLSGFVMARTYEARLQQRLISGWRFLAKRYKRLWGWMALGTIIGLLAVWGDRGFSTDLAVTFALMMAMLPAFNMAETPYLLNQPLWSIVYELVANAFHAIVLVHLNKLALLIVAALCAIGLAWAISAHGFPRGGFPEYHWLTLLRVGLAYILGIVLWRMWGDTPPLRIPFGAAFAALPAYVLMVWVWDWAYAPLVFILVLAPLMMMGGLNIRITSAKTREAAALLGAMSFPLYAVHYPAIQLLQHSWGFPVLAIIGAGLWLRYGRPRGQAEGTATETAEDKGAMRPAASITPS